MRTRSHEVIITIPGRPSVTARLDSLEDAARLASVLAVASEVRTVVRLPDGTEIDVGDVVNSTAN
jgi:hypothetical protein